MSNGIIDRVFTSLHNNPSLAMGSLTFAIAFALVAGNAFYAQSGDHPDPIWATRDLTTTQSVEPDIRLVPTKRIQPKILSRDFNSDQTNTVPVKSRLVEDIQISLKRTGDYTGQVDGLIGPVTRAAISRFQARKHLPQSGQPSPELLALIKRNLPAPIVSSKKDALSHTIASSKPVATPTQVNLDESFIKRLQQTLINSNGVEIDVDGIFGSQTKNALRLFQKRNGLQVTGNPDYQTLRYIDRQGLMYRG